MPKEAEGRIVDLDALDIGRPKELASMTRVMYALAASLACAHGALGEDGSYLHRQKMEMNGVIQEFADVYLPQAGDLVFFDDHSMMWKFLYKLAGTDMPDHTGIVFRLPDGRPGLLEAGPDDGRLAGPY